MASSINASTSGAGGVITTADNSGVLNLQSSGTTVATIQPSGLSLPSGSTFNAANTFGYKNKLINGNFLVWQRGAAVLPSLGSLTQYVSDRWACYQTGAATTVAQSPGFGGFQYCAAFNGIASNTEVTMLQYIESLNSYPLVGSFATFSVWVYASVAKTITLGIGYANTADTFSSVTTVYASSNSHLGGGWQQFTLTSSAALSSSFANGIRIAVTYPNCTTGTFAITGAQLEVGSQATSFDFRSIGTELALCQRYYSKIGTVFGTTYAGSGTLGMIYNPTTMRTTPTYSATALNGYALTASDNQTGYIYYANVITGAAVTGLTASAEL